MNNIDEEIANYLLNCCFVVGDISRDKYHYLINRIEKFNKIFEPLGYDVKINRELCVVQLVSKHPTSKVVFKKYESILLLIFRLVYIQKRQSLPMSDRVILASIKDIEKEYEKLNLPKKFDKVLLDDFLKSVKKYNLLRQKDKIADDDFMIEIYPSIMLAISNDDLLKAHEQANRLLAQYSGQDIEDFNDDKND